METNHEEIVGEAAWDERYRERPQTWSGQPNQALVAEVTGLNPGTALEAGAGEGGDAIWLSPAGLAGHRGRVVDSRPRTGAGPR